MGELKKWREQNWVRIGRDGKIKGPCGTSKNKKNPDRCLPLAKARSLSKRQLAKTARKKKAAGRKGKQFVSVNEGYEEIVRENDSKEFAKYLREICVPENIQEAKYKGRTVTLNKPMRGDSKKFKVYVNSGKKNADGSIKVKKVNFGHGGTTAKKAGQKTMKIRKSNPKARSAFRARHNCDNPGPKTKARYWSCKKW